MEIIKLIWHALGDSKEQIVSISAVIGVYIAFSGLRTWRKELKGKSEYQKAKELLKSVYRVKSGFMAVRAPAIYSYEYPNEFCDNRGHLKEEHRYEGTVHVYQTRFKILDDAFKELEEQNLDAQVEWGNEFEDVIKPLRLCRIELILAVQNHIEDFKVAGMRESTIEERRDRQAKLYYVGEDSKHDPFTLQINKAIEGFEKKLRPHINKSSILFSFSPIKRR